MKERDSAKRIALYEAMQRDHRERSPFVIMMQQVEVAAMRKSLTGLQLGLLSDRTSYAAITKA